MVIHLEGLYDTERLASLLDEIGVQGYYILLYNQARCVLSRALGIINVHSTQMVVPAGIKVQGARRRSRATFLSIYAHLLLYNASVRRESQLSYKSKSRA